MRMTSTHRIIMLAIRILALIALVAGVPLMLFAESQGWRTTGFLMAATAGYALLLPHVLHACEGVFPDDAERR